MNKVCQHLSAGYPAVTLPWSPGPVVPEGAKALGSPPRGREVLFWLQADPRDVRQDDVVVYGHRRLGDTFRTTHSLRRSFYTWTWHAHENMNLPLQAPPESVWGQGSVGHPGPF